MHRLLVFVLLSTLMACGTSRRYLEYDAHRNIFTHVPAYAGTGDSLFLVVEDTVWGNAYAAVPTTDTISEPPRAPVAGAIDLKKMAEGFPALLVAVASAAGKELAAEPAAASQTLAEALEEAAVPRADVHALLIPHRDMFAASPAALDASRRLVARRDSLRSEISKRCNTALHRFQKYLLARPDQMAVIEFIARPEAHALARSLANDGYPAHVDSLVGVFSDPSAAFLESTVITKAVGDLAPYARRVSVLSTYMPIDPASYSPDPKLNDHLTQVRICNEAAPALEKIEAEARQAPFAHLFDNPVPMVIDTPGIAGIQLRQFVHMDDPGETRFQAFFDDLGQIARGVNRTANALNILPMWTKDLQRDSIPLGAFYRPVRVTIQPVRSDRVGRFRVVPLVVAGAPGAAAQTPDSEGNQAAAPGGAAVQKQGDVAAKAQEQVDRSASQWAIGSRLELPQSPAAPTAFVDVLQRYRFRFGVGATYSPLESTVYETEEDSTAAGKGTWVRVVGASPARYFPSAMLSYIVFPLRGKITAAQAYTHPVLKRANAGKVVLDYIRQMGLSLQGGLSLSDPTQHLFAGLATEPLPGLEIGFGYHFGYVETTSQTIPEAGVFIPKGEGIPLRDEWKRESGAISVSLDAGIIVNSFGTLLGLK